MVVIPTSYCWSWLPSAMLSTGDETALVGTGMVCRGFGTVNAQEFYHVLPKRGFKLCSTI